MSIPPNQLAAHALRLKSPSIAQAATDALYRLRPELETHYGLAGRRHCVTDITHHLRFLAAAVELGDARVFASPAAAPRSTPPPPPPPPAPPPPTATSPPPH